MKAKPIKMHMRTPSDPVLFKRFIESKRNTAGTSYGAVSQLNLLSARHFTIKDTDISYRELNHWASLGLIEDEREEESRGWRKLSVRDILWLKTLKELRDFGIPLEKVKTIYDQNVRKPDVFVSTAFDDALWACYGESPIFAFLVVLKTGQSLILSLKTLRVMERQGLLTRSHLRISLNELFCAIASSSGVMPEEIEEEVGNKELKEIVEFIAATKDSEEIRIRRKDGKLIGTDETKRFDASKRVGDLLKGIEYGTALVTFENSKPVSTLITKKKRPKK